MKCEAIHSENDVFRNANYAKQKQKQMSACLQLIKIKIKCWLLFTLTILKRKAASPDMTFLSLMAEEVVGLEGEVIIEIIIMVMRDPK